MMQSPQASPYRPEIAILALGDAFYDRVVAADFPRTILRFRNQRWADAVGIGGLSHAQWLAHFGRFEPLEDNLPEPLALRYHGHQFRAYNPDIGDGRGFLFAQLRDGQDRLLDLGTKGSGQTPHSRFGDGRLTLKGGVREVLATEMLEALGVETSKSFSLIETGEALERGDEPSPTRSSVLVRLQHSHIRIGTFQRLAFYGETDDLRRLTDYCLRHYYSESRHCERSEAIPADDDETRLLRSARNDDEEPAVALLRLVVDKTAGLAASYVAAGFVHGVLNSDNIAITAQSFDYGPWRWTPYWDGAFTAAYFDHSGLYAFGRQPEAIYWDVAQLAGALSLIADEAALQAALEAYPEHFRRALTARVLARLGVAARGPDEDRALVAAVETGLAAQTVTIDRFFFDWRGGRRRAASPADPVYDSDDFAAFREAVAAYSSAVSTDHDYWAGEAPCAMHIDEVEAIWARIGREDDWSDFDTKINAVRRMGAAMSGALDPMSQK